MKLVVQGSKNKTKAKKAYRNNILENKDFLVRSPQKTST